MLFKKNTPVHFGILILAAGASSRLGRPKQLLTYKGSTLLSHSVKVALSSKADPIIVVVGAHSEQLKEEINFGEVLLVDNPEWKEGMASSIRCGIQFLKNKFPELEGAIVMMCDQPGVTKFVLDNLILAHEASGKPIVASGYANTFGPPVLFHKVYFETLMELKNDVGARGVIGENSAAVEIVPFAEGNFDIDTEEDYEKLTRREHQ